MIDRSLGAAASGIETMQTELDIIGNNIANSETVGFKSGTAEFQNLLSNVLTPAGGAGANSGSINPSAIGAGATLAGVYTNFAEGAVSQTGIATDVAIAGNGFLVVDSNGQTGYTRDGQLQLDTLGRLSEANGGLVLGWLPGQTTSSAPGPLSIVAGSTEPPAQTQNITLGGNLDAASTTPVTLTTSIFDSLGATVPVTLTFTPSGGGSWSLQGTVPGVAAPLWAAPQTVTFGNDGQLATLNGAAVGAGTTALAIGNPPANFTWAKGAPSIDLPPVGSQNALTEFANTSTAAVASQDGYTSGVLQSYGIGANGTITGTYSNGQSQALGTIALAQFANPNGLIDMGGTTFQQSAASGNPTLGTPGEGGLGTLQGGAVEGSNVDLAAELTNLIEAQTAYQANTKVVNSSSAALSSLIQMS
jgi:flagellar hook protein FlgE